MEASLAKVQVFMVYIGWFKDADTKLGRRFQQVDTSVLGLSAEEAKLNPFIASMGIYVFKKEILLKLLRSYSYITSLFS